MPSIEDYLTKQIYIDNNVVTFRSLSRQFTLHVNAAKNELAKFHTKSPNAETRSFATYLISGELFPKARPNDNLASQTEDGMEVDSEVSDENLGDEGEEEVPLTTITLVGENDLENAKSRYARIFSVHVYCLSPSPLTDARLIRDPSVIVYQADAKDDPASSIALGRVVGPDVRVGKTRVSPPVASSSKTTDPLSRKPTLKSKAEVTTPPMKEKEKEKEKEKLKAGPTKLKTTGKLDWSKAKKSSDADKNKVKEEEEIRVKAEKTRTTPTVRSPSDDTKRGIKRKAALPAASDTEETSSKDKEKVTSVPATQSDIKLQKNRIVSDDESDAPRRQPKAAKGKPRASIADADGVFGEGSRSLSTMWDVDDSQVEMASARRPAPKPEPESPVPEDDDIEMVSEQDPTQQTQEQDDEDMDEDKPKPKPKPRKKKEKKIVPVGRNGLKKKRVMKSRMTTDAKGYMVTEDYSSYESVDEEAEQEAEKKPRGKKATPGTKVKKSGSDDETPSKPKPVARTSSLKSKGSGAKAGGQGNLKDFFGKKK